MERAKNMETILAISGGLLVLYLVFKLILLVYIALGLIFIALFINTLAGYISFLWLKLAEALGFVTSKILLSVVFFLLLTPIALLQKLFSKNPLQLKNEGRKSRYYERNHTYTAEDFKNPW